MNFRISWMSAIAVALLALPLFSFNAVAQIAAPSNNGKAVHANPSSWASRIMVDGVPNLHRVAPNFYRSGQPTSAGFRALTMRYGVRTVINLRDAHSDEPYVTGLHLRLHKIGMHVWHIEQEDLAQALHILRTAMPQGPTLVHCTFGADRTGVVTALYRILYQGWSREAAIDEMEHGDFGYHDMWINIPMFVRGIDLEQLKRDIDALKE